MFDPATLQLIKKIDVGKGPMDLLRPWTSVFSQTIMAHTTLLQSMPRPATLWHCENGR